MSESVKHCLNCRFRHLEAWVKPCRKCCELPSPLDHTIIKDFWPAWEPIEPEEKI